MIISSRTKYVLSKISTLYLIALFILYGNANYSRERIIAIFVVFPLIGFIFYYFYYPKLLQTEAELKSLNEINKPWKPISKGILSWLFSDTTSKLENKYEKTQANKPESKIIPLFIWPLGILLIINRKLLTE